MPQKLENARCTLQGHYNWACWRLGYMQGISKDDYGDIGETETMWRPLNVGLSRCHLVGHEAEEQRSVAVKHRNYHLTWQIHSQVYTQDK